jgi:hypothetical protein
LAIRSGHAYCPDAFNLEKMVFVLLVFDFSIIVIALWFESRGTEAERPKTKDRL